MDRIKIKETAKALLKKNHWLCVAVSLVVSMLSALTARTASYLELDTSQITSPDGTKEFVALPDWLIEIEASNLPLFLVIFSAIFFISIILCDVINAFVGNQVKVGSCRFFLKYRKNQPVEIGELFKSYSDKTFLNVAKVSFIKNFSIFLWTALCIVPGIIKTYEYAAVDYILSTNPTIDHKRALELSKKIMHGHKLELFELYLSFLGWYILSLFTCGILAVLYIMPYQMIAEAEFFSYVRELAIYNGIISYNDIPDYDEYFPQQSTFNSYPYYTSNPYYQPNVDFTPVQPVNQVTYTEADMPHAEATEQYIPEPTTEPVTENDALPTQETQTEQE